MNIVRSIIAFITDDLVTAAVVVAWAALIAVLTRAGTIAAEVGALLYLGGILAALALGVWRRAR